MPHKTKSGITPDDLLNLIMMWIDAPSQRHERWFLEAHPELLDSRSASILNYLISQYTEYPDMVQVLHDHLALLRNIEARGNTSDAIDKGYIDIYGGLILDLPPWLEEIEHQCDKLRNIGGKEAEKRISLLRAAIERTKGEADIASEVLAELNIQLYEAFREAVDMSEEQRQEERIICLLAALQIYTYKCYPFQYAKIQNNLGLIYMQRMEGDRCANLEQAIACFQEALRVYTFEVSPEHYALIQNNLGVAYVKCIAGDQRVNLGQVIACFREALRVYTFEDFPEDYARTQNNLGRAYENSHGRGSTCQPRTSYCLFPGGSTRLYLRGFSRRLR